MCSPPSGCTATTRPCRCWPRARRSPAGYGPMSATTARSAGGPPAVLFHYSRDRRGEHPERHLAGYAGILQADAYAASAGSMSRPGGRADHRGALLGPCTAQASSSSPTSAGRARRPAVPPGAGGGPPDRRDLRPSSATINGHPADERLAYRREHAAPLVGELEAWMSKRAPQALPPCRGRQGHRLHAQALAGLHAGSSTTAGSASPTTPPNERCAASPSAERPGCSAAPIAAASAPPSCTR